MWVALTILAGLGAFLSFAWGLKAHFRAEGGMPVRMRHLAQVSAAAFLLFIGLIIWSGVGRAAGIAALALFLASSALFWWAVRTTRAHPPAVAYADNIPTMIHTGGPYAHVRHPFYLAYCLAWIATAIAGGPIQWVPAILIIFWYYKTAAEEERIILTSDIAFDYAQYRIKTGLIFPKIN